MGSLRKARNNEDEPMKAPTPPRRVAVASLGSPENAEVTTAALSAPRVPSEFARGTGLPSISRGESPHIKDAHAEFRKGAHSRTLAFGALAVGLFAAMAYVARPAPEPAAEPLGPAPSVRAETFAIGTSQAPDRIAEPQVPTMESLAKKPEAAPEPAAMPAGIIPEKQFAAAFGAAAEQAKK
jgi:hypothetical protein